MPSHVLVGLSGPAQAASDAKPPQEAKGAPAKRSRKLGVRRLIKLVVLAVTISAVGLGVWFLQPVPAVIALVHTVTSKASTFNVPTATASNTPQEQAQAEATSSATTSTTPSGDTATSSVPDVHPPTLEAAARLARLQARQRSATRVVASGAASSVSAASSARAASSANAATTALPETEPATVADSSGGAAVSASTAAGAPAAAELPPTRAPAVTRPALAPPPQIRTAPAAALSRLYGPTDTDVAPPRPIVQQKLGGIIGAIDSKAEVTIEFVVDEFGYVESAKAKSVPRSVGESVLMATGLHAIKSWRFQPAEKNGQPVRYLNSISFGAY